MFLSLLNFLENRPLLILDEAHELPSEVLKFQSFSITRIKWRDYLRKDSEIPNRYDNIKGWIDFLIETKKDILERMRL